MTRSGNLGAGTRFNGRVGGHSETRRFAKRVCAIRPLPRESGTAAPEVPVSRGGLIDGPAQFQRFNDALWGQREMFADERGDFFGGYCSRTESIGHDGDRLRNA